MCLRASTGTLLGLALLVVSCSGDDGNGVSDDTVPPVILSRSPAPDATGVTTDVVIEIVFSEALDCLTVDDSSVVLMGSGGTVACDGARATLTPNAPLQESRGYTVAVYTDVADQAGNRLAGDTFWNFTTGDFSAPEAPSADNPAPPATTTRAAVPVGGSKEAGTAVHSNGAEIVPLDNTTTWQATFELPSVATHSFSLTARDAAGNVSATSTDFSIQRDASTGVVLPPIVNAVVSPTAVGNQVITGVKDPDTSIWVDGVERSPEDSKTSWSLLLPLTAGAQTYQFTAKDPALTESTAVPVSITYNEPSRLTGGELQIDLSLQDLWDYLGDEMRVSAAGDGLDHIAVDIWVEGPITLVDDMGNADPSDNVYERCVYDSQNHERRHTRLVATVVHGTYVGCLGTPETWCTNFSSVWNSSYWGEPNYFSPNWLAALIETGRWEPRLSRGVDRRDGLGHGWTRPPDGLPPCPPTWELTSDGQCRPYMRRAPEIDGLTEASTTADWDRGTRTASNGNQGSLGNWSIDKSYSWDLTTAASGRTQRIRPGPYLVSISVSHDRGASLQASQWQDVINTDRETCWDNPAHDSMGAHRAEMIVMLDGQGSSPVDTFLAEKGHAERVTQCSNPLGEAGWATCSCPRGSTANGSAVDSFPCPYPPNALYDAGLPAAQQAEVKYMQQDRFTSGPTDFPVRLRYCPAGPCP